MTDTMRKLYIHGEAKKDFKDWTKPALEFALRNYNLNENIKNQIKSLLS